MASSVNPQFYSEYTFPTDYSEFSSTPSLVGGTTTSINSNMNGGVVPLLWGSHSQESLVPLFDNGCLDQIVSSESDIISSVRMSMSSSSSPLFPDQEQVIIGNGGCRRSELAVPTLSDYKMGLCGLAGVENFGSAGYGYQPNIWEFGEECCGYFEDLKPTIYPAAAGENWGIQGNQMTGIDQESNIKVGRYSEEERKERILRYLKKRNQRNFNKTIKYACRKTLADRRVRVRGRFARNTELCEEEAVTKKNNIDNPIIKENKEFYCGDSIQIKTDEEDWLQEAMTSLMYLPYIAG